MQEKLAIRKNYQSYSIEIGRRGHSRETSGPANIKHVKSMSATAHLKTDKESQLRITTGIKFQTSIQR